jgi:hypothetical protein
MFILSVVSTPYIQDLSSPNFQKEYMADIMPLGVIAFYLRTFVQFLMILLHLDLILLMLLQR